MNDAELSAEREIMSFFIAAGEQHKHRLKLLPTQHVCFSSESLEMSKLVLSPRWVDEEDYTR